MKTFQGSANGIYPGLIDVIVRRGHEVKARGYQTLELHPVTVMLEEPRKRIVTSYGRPINVAFALAEVLWILAGSKEVDFLRRYNSGISQFSDDGLEFNAAYGYRLRHAHGYDQLADLVHTLLFEPDSRQGTMAIWHPADRSYDALEKLETKDRACNLVSRAMIRDGALDWIQVMRSNDAIWGTPYNWIQWTSIQEWVARQLNIEPGLYWHIADSLHIYLDGFAAEKDPQAHRSIRPFDLYKELGSDGHAPILGSLIHIEEVYEVAAGGGFRSWSGDDSFAYWVETLIVLRAHRCYTEGFDRLALETLMEGDPVFAAAAMRFYAHHRWNKRPGEFKDIRTNIGDAYPDRVAEWILSPPPGPRHLPPGVPERS